MSSMASTSHRKLEDYDEMVLSAEEGNSDEDDLHIGSNSSEFDDEDEGGDDEEEDDDEDGGGEEYEDEDEEGDMGEQQEARAEKEIEGDFDRLVQNIRLGDTVSSSQLAKDWDINIEEREAEFRDDLREASGVGRKRRKRGAVRNAGPVLSLQVRSLIGDGNQAYVDSNIPEAIRIMQEVIRIEPRAAAAWSVLAQCYEDMNQEKKALQLRIMAAHLRHDADEWDRLARQSKEHGYIQQALYCYRKVYSLDPSNVFALWDRATLAKEIGDYRTARNAFLAILKNHPHDLTVLRELHTILVELSDLTSCANLLQQAFEFYQREFPNGKDKDKDKDKDTSNATTSLEPAPTNPFSPLDLLLLADLYNALGAHEDAIHTIRRGTRWLQGRAAEKWWDAFEDDREFDGEGWLPRGDVEGGGEGGGGQKEGRHDLDANARHRLAVARIKMGDAEEGKLHASAVLSEDVLDYAVLFAEIADAYYEREMYAEAKPIYELLGGDPATSSMYVLLQTASCLRMLDELKEAAEVYEHIRIADPTNNEVKMKLAEIYEVTGEPRKALDLVYEIIDSRKKRAKERDPDQPADASTTSASLFGEHATSSRTKASAIRSQNRITHAQIRELEAEREKEVIRGYKRLLALWPGMTKGVEEEEKEWLIEAEKIVEAFRETRNLFSTTRTLPFRGMFPRSRAKNLEMQGEEAHEAEEDRMASRLHLDIERDSMSRKSTRDKQGVNVFRGVTFENWLRVFIQYCFLLTKRGQYDQAEEILRHIMLSNAYQTRERLDTIRLALMTCAVYMQRYPIVVEQARKIIGQHQFNDEPLRILLASLASGLRATDAFITSTLQKHLFREMKLSDFAVKNPELLKWTQTNKRYAPIVQTKSAENDEAEEEADEMDTPSTTTQDASRPEIPTRQNPVITTIYGQICIAAKSYQSALFYLLHSYDYCQDDPLICLSLAIASIGRAMQRQSDNRHHLVTQAMAFLTKYRELRGTDAQGLGEVEFNFGRMFQQLGLFSHAVKHYERVLELAEKQKDETFACDAAYNLSQIFVYTGAIPLADALYRRWLSI